jgi:hypothetical protein
MEEAESRPRPVEAFDWERVRAGEEDPLKRFSTG